MNEKVRIIEVKLNKENLEKIYNIDKTFYKDEILTMSWYLKRYNENHNAILILDDKNNCVGYLVSVPIKKELYETIKKGIIINDLYINPNMYINDSKYYYISSFVIINEYRYKGHGQKMLEYLFKNCKGKYCALTITNDGFRIAKKNMKLFCTINEKTNVFIKNVR